LHISLKNKHAHAPQHAHAQKISKRSGEAERSGEEGFGGVPDYDAHSTLTRSRKPCAVEKRHYSDCNQPGRAAQLASVFDDGLLRPTMMDSAVARDRVDSVLEIL
jgi:hypothetical protein